MRNANATFGVLGLGALGLLSALTPALAADCPGHPDAIGTSRTIVVDPKEHTRIGSMQYSETLPLADHEVVLTFDDGPLPPYTNRILETLASECVKATFFMVGRQANAYPAMVRRVYNEGHTVASHSQNHPLIFTRLAMAQAEQEINQGINSVSTALGDPRALAPFFRFPGLGRSHAIESYLSDHGIMTWSADFPADDWTHISAEKVMARALERIERKGKGVLLLHDIQPATVLALPALLKELKRRNYRIVEVTPAGPDRPKTVTEPETWAARHPQQLGWPRLIEPPSDELPAPSARTLGWPRPFYLSEFNPPPVSPISIEQLIDAPSAPAWPSQAVAGVPDNSAAPNFFASRFASTDPYDSASTIQSDNAEAASLVVVSADVLAEMVISAPWSSRPKSTTRTTLRATPAKHHPHAVGAQKPALRKPLAKSLGAAPKTTSAAI